MKTAEEIMSEFNPSGCSVAHGNEYSEFDVIKMMHRYANQFRNPPKKTIEERKRQFEINLKEVIGQPVCYDQLTIDFFDYWTEHGPNDKKMRFEKEKVFDIKKRLDRWKRNQKQPHGKQSADDAIRDLLSN